MKRIGFAAVLMVLMMSVAFALGGCSGPEMSLDVNEAGTEVTINADGAAKDSFATSGTLYIKEGEALIAEPAFEKGTVNIKLIPATELGEDAGKEELDSAVDEANAVFDEDLTGDTAQTYEVPTGEYYVSVKVVEEATGTAVLKAGAK